MHVSESLLQNLYNREIKETFLDQYLEDDETRESYAVYLKQASEWEYKINKDLYEFSREDALDLFSNSFTNKLTTLRLYHSICKQYGSWATTRGYNKTGVNSFELIKFKQHILPMLNKKGIENKYLTEEQIWEVANQARNYQDSVAMILSFYGIKGNKSIELINLTRDDIDVLNNKIKVITQINKCTGEIFTRTIDVPKRVIDISLKAWGETEYIKPENFNAKSSFIELADTDYVLKPSLVGKKVDDELKTTSQLIARRTKTLLTEAGYKNASIQDIYTSGKLNLLEKIEKENGKLTIENFKAVNVTFGENESNYSNIRELYKIVKESKAE